MIRFIIKKLLYGGFVLLGVITVIFLLFNATSENPARNLAGQNATPEMVAQIEHDLGVDLPLYKQYLLYLNDISPVSFHRRNEASRINLDTARYDFVEVIPMENSSIVFKYPHLRRSYKTDRWVSDVIFQALPGTIILAIASILIAMILGVLLGIIAGLNQGSFFDNGSMVFAVFGMSGPSYFVAIIVAWIAAYEWYEVTYIPMMPVFGMGLGLLFGLIFFKFNTQSKFSDTPINYILKMILKGFGVGFIVWFIMYAFIGLFGSDPTGISEMFFELPGTGLEGEGKLWDTDEYGEEFLNPKNLILPALTLGIRPLAVVLQLTRSAMLDVMSQDYIRTAKSKGLSMRIIIVRHALKNALTPVITAASGWFASLLAGAVFIEQIFNWDGLGLQIYTAIINEDLPVIMGSVLVIASFFVIINMTVDIIYGYLDPRVRNAKS